MLYVLLEFKDVVSIFSAAMQSLIISTAWHITETQVHRTKILNLPSKCSTKSLLLFYTEFSFAIHVGGKYFFSELVSSVLGYKVVCSHWFSIFFWKACWSFTAFLKAWFLFHSAIKVSFSHIQGTVKLNIRMCPLNLPQTFGKAIWSIWTEFTENSCAVGTYYVYVHVQSL